jgi:HK97 family phage prohead protease
MNDLERRFFSHELRAQKGEDGAVTLIGYGAVFNSRSLDLGGFKEIIKPGAFSRALKDDPPDDVRALFNHDPNHVLGRSASGTLKLEEDAIGLRYEIKMPDTQIARDLAASIDRGDVSQSSFAFRVRAGGENWGEDADGTILRSITDVKLFDVSPVTYPAYPDTSVAKRALTDWRAQAHAGDQHGPSADVEVCRRRLNLIEKANKHNTETCK